MPGRTAISFTLHAYDRMLERDVSRQEVLSVVESGEVVEDYPEDRPFPSKLLLGETKGRPLHVVVAWDTRKEEWLVITVYFPEPWRWERDWRTRRK